jgi:hypothetical protein
MTAMKIVGHKSEKMHRRYNQIVPEDLRNAVSKLSTYRANTVIIPDLINAEAKIVSIGNAWVGA